MLNKRGKVVRDMCEQILVKFHQDVESAEWGRLFEIAESRLGGISGPTCNRGL